MIDRVFALAGRAIFTVMNPEGKRYTFRITHSEGNDRFPPAWFLSLLTGTDNENDYTYCGMIDPELGTVRLTQRSAYSAESLPVKVAQFALRVLWNRQALPDGYSIHHEGRCGRCARLLTVPESIENGIGPECMRKMQTA